VATTGGGKSSLPLIFSLSQTVKTAMEAPPAPNGQGGAEAPTNPNAQQGEKKGQQKKKGKQQQPKTNPEQGEKPPQPEKQQGVKYPCNFCEDPGHYAQHCPLTKQQRKSSLKKKNKCFNCLRRGHNLKKCNKNHNCHDCLKHRHTEGLKIKHHTWVCTYNGNPAKDDRPQLTEPAAKQPSLPTPTAAVTPAATQPATAGGSA
jgi:hypothetical protein